MPAITALPIAPSPICRIDRGNRQTSTTSAMSVAAVERSHRTSSPVE